MKIRFRLFATLMKWLPDNPIDHVLEKSMTLGEFLKQKGIPEESTAIYMCNGSIVNLQYVLRDGDDIEIFPLMDGG